MTRQASSLLLFLFAAFGLGWAQNAGPQPANTAATTTTIVPKDPKDLMLLAARVNGLGGADMKPWHLKANYQTFDADGKPKDHGIFEEWWASLTKYKVSYTSNGFNQVEYRDGDKDLVTGDADSVPLPEEMVKDYLVSPLPAMNELETLRYSSKNTKFGQVKLGCIQPTHLKLVLPMALAKYYCFEPDMAAIRMENFSGGFYTIFNGIVLAGDHYLADQISAQNANLPVLKVSVTTIEFPSKFEDAFFAAPASAMPAPPTRISPSQLVGRKIGGEDPHYPMEAKEKWIQGLVMLECDISKSGEVIDLHVVSGPKELQQSSYDAVKTWKYKPFLHNGQPVEVRTEINVIYTMSD